MIEQVKIWQEEMKMVQVFIHNGKAPEGTILSHDDVGFVFSSISAGKEPETMIIPYTAVECIKECICWDD